MPKKKKVTKKTVKKVAKKATKKVAKEKTTTKKCAKKCTCKVTKPFNKSQVATAIADMTELSKKEVGCVLDALNEVIFVHLKKRSGVGEFTLPGICKYKVVEKPATKARKGVNPFTGEEMMFKAKPARRIVKIRALKKVKDAAK